MKHAPAVNKQVVSRVPEGFAQGLGLWVRGSGFRIRGILGLGLSTTVWFISVEGLGLQGFHLSLCFLLGVFTLSIRQCTFSVYSVLILMRGHKLDKRRSV